MWHMHTSKASCLSGCFETHIVLLSLWEDIRFNDVLRVISSSRLVCVERDIWECAGGGGSGSIMSLSSLDLSDVHITPNFPETTPLASGSTGDELEVAVAAAAAPSPLSPSMAPFTLGRFGPLTVEAVDLALDEVWISMVWK